MTKPYKRRQFIKILGAGAGGAVLGTTALKAFQPVGQQDNSALLGKKTDSATPTYCEICFWKCAGWVHKKDGKPWKITGNPEDPNSNGRFCPRGTGGIGTYTDP
ncbi:MAG TPA: nitrate reductase, partial [Anaerolineales bacterium]|nr:nitrate reductase [Anaerolineales bacterium]